MKLLSFGEIIWDVYPDEKYLGGAPLNFAAHYMFPNTIRINYERILFKK